MITTELKPPDGVKPLKRKISSEHLPTACQII